MSHSGGHTEYSIWLCHAVSNLCLCGTGYLSTGFCVHRYVTVTRTFQTTKRKYIINGSGFGIIIGKLFTHVGLIFATRYFFFRNEEEWGGAEKLPSTQLII